jgi:hypothetical protein
MKGALHALAILSLVKEPLAPTWTLWIEKNLFLLPGIQPIHPVAHGYAD